MHFTILVTLCLFTTVLGSTVIPDATTTESTEREGFTFKYDPISHMMAIKTHRICYIYSMTSQEIHDVHTQHGLRTIEIKMIQEIDSGTGLSTMSANDLDSTSPSLAEHFCKRAQEIHKITVM